MMVKITNKTKVPCWWLYWTVTFSYSCFPPGIWPGVYQCPWETLRRFRVIPRRHLTFLDFSCTICEEEHRTQLSIWGSRICTRILGINENSIYHLCNITYPLCHFLWLRSLASKPSMPVLEDFQCPAVPTWSPDRLVYTSTRLSMFSHLALMAAPM